MWTALTDCGKQLTVNSRLRETLHDGYNIYEIKEVEYDQYHLHLITKDGQPAEDVNQVLNGEQLMRHNFEVEQEA